MHGTLARVAVLTSVLAIAGQARADDSLSVHIDYRAPTNCPDLKAFREQVLARTNGVRFDDANPNRTFGVTISRDASGFDGELVVYADHELRGARRVTGEKCDEIASALALVVALDANGVAEQKKSSNASSSPLPKEPRREKPAPAASRWRLGVGAGASIASGVAPGPVLAIPAHVELLRFGPSVLSPSFRLGFERTFTRTFAASGASTSFTATTGKLDLCPLRFSIDRLALTPCARGEVGVAASGASGIVGAQSSTDPLAFAGITGRISWWILDPVVLEIEGTARAALVRQNYEFRPNLAVYETPVVSASAAAGLGVYFF